MTSYHVYADQISAQAAADDLTGKYLPGVDEKDIAGIPASHQQVTQQWDVPRQRADEQWVIKEHPEFLPVPAPIATEPYRPDWFIDKLAQAAAEGNLT